MAAAVCPGRLAPSDRLSRRPRRAHSAGWADRPAPIATDDGRSDDDGDQRAGVGVARAGVSLAPGVLAQWHPSALGGLHARQQAVQYALELLARNRTS
jgi:hypothetical protein